MLKKSNKWQFLRDKTVSSVCKLQNVHKKLFVTLFEKRACCPHQVCPNLTQVWMSWLATPPRLPSCPARRLRKAGLTWLLVDLEISVKTMGSGGVLRANSDSAVALVRARSAPLWPSP